MYEYEPVYSTYCGKIGNGRTLAVTIEPCFGTVLIKYENVKIYWYDGEKRKDETAEKKEILITPETQWVVELNGKCFFRVIVTEYTKTVQTFFGDKMNKIINQKVKEAQKDYQKRKQTEKRLYFYDAEKFRLSLYTDGTSCCNDGCRYRLDQLFTPYHAIDKRYHMPEENCFILGKIRRTIGTKDRKLMDFIEPVAEFNLEDENDWDCFGDGENWLGNIIFKMLKFSIMKEKPAGLTVTRIENKMHCSVHKFLKILNTALEAGDVPKVKEFYNVIHTMQDCSKEKFQILKGILEEPVEKEREICCYPSIEHWIKYENGEQEKKPASWIAENIDRCTNKEVTYLEKVEKYRFY